MNDKEQAHPQAFNTVEERANYLLTIATTIEKLSNSFKNLSLDQDLNCNKQRNEILALISLATEPLII